MGTDFSWIDANSATFEINSYTLPKATSFWVEGDHDRSGFGQGSARQRIRIVGWGNGCDVIVQIDGCRGTIVSDDGEFEVAVPLAPITQNGGNFDAGDPADPGYPLNVFPWEPVAP